MLIKRFPLLLSINYIPHSFTPKINFILSQMTVLQQAHHYVDQLRREANKTRMNVSEAIQDMMVLDNLQRLEVHLDWD